MADLKLNSLKVLKVFVANANRDFYGRESAEAAKLNYGIVHPILKDLEDKGLLTSEWENIDESAKGRRARKYYRVTAKGLASYKQILEEEIEPLLVPIPNLSWQV